MTAAAAMSGPVRRPPIPAQPIYELTLGSPYRAAWRLASYVLLVAATMAVGGIALTFKIRSLLSIIPMAYHRLCCWLLDIHIEIRGTMSTTRPTLFVCNHTSYLDISVLGSIITGSFIAKAEVADWPVFGYLAKLQRTVFIDRQRRTTTHHQRDQLAVRLDEGDNLILFPGGRATTATGRCLSGAPCWRRRAQGGKRRARAAALDDSAGITGLCAPEWDADRPVAAATSCMVRRYGVARSFMARGRTWPYHRGHRVPSPGHACPVSFPQGPQRALPAGGRRRRGRRPSRSARRRREGGSGDASGKRKEVHLGARGC